MGLSISDTGLALIKKFEGCKLTAYQDSVGVWTIGYGHTSGVKKGQAITQAQADAYLKSDCASAEKNVNGFYSKYKWNQNQFDALVSFAFNIGSINQLTANGTRTIAQISSKITAYNKAGGKVLTGLTNRRKAEKELFDKAIASSSSTGTSYTKTQFVKDVQSAIGVTVDGIAGSKTLAATPTLSAKKNSKHAAVKPVQKYLYALGYTSIGSADGVAGTKFTTAVKAYQKANSCTSDGEITAKGKTWKKLLGIS